MAIDPVQVQELLGGYSHEEYTNQNRIMGSGIMKSTSPNIGFEGREGNVNAKRFFTPTEFTQTRSEPGGADTVLTDIASTRESYVRFANSMGTRVKNTDEYWFNVDAAEQFGYYVGAARKNLEEQQMIRTLTGVVNAFGNTTGYNELVGNIAKLNAGVAAASNKLNLESVLQHGYAAWGDKFMLSEFVLVCDGQGAANLSGLNTGTYRNTDMSLLTQKSAEIPGVMKLPNGLTIVVSDHVPAFAAGRATFNAEPSVSENSPASATYTDAAAALTGINGIFPGTDFATASLGDGKVIRSAFFVRKSAMTMMEAPMGVGVNIGPMDVKAEGGSGAQDVTYRYENIMHPDGLSWSTDAADEYPTLSKFADDLWTPTVSRKLQNISGLFYNE